MKKLAFYTGLLLLVVSCSETAQRNRIVVLKDLTESDFIAKPTPEAIIPKLGLDVDLWKGVVFRYSTISDVSINRHYDLALPSAQSLLGNSLERNKTVQRFTHRIDSILSIATPSVAKAHSSIWLPLVEEIRFAQEDTSSQTIIYLFSDLRENSRFWSSYRPEDIQELESNFDSVRAKFLLQAKTYSTQTNVKVVVVFAPATPMDDYHFQKMKRLYDALMKDLGIPIEFVANI